MPNNRISVRAEVLEPLGYVSGQFGKNHLGDQNKFLPTVHGFSEFFGNLYHLNAEEEPEDPKHPKDPRFKEMFGPRGVPRPRPHAPMTPPKRSAGVVWGRNRSRRYLGTKGHQLGTPTPDSRPR